MTAQHNYRDVLGEIEADRAKRRTAGIMGITAIFQRRMAADRHQSQAVCAACGICLSCAGPGCPWPDCPHPSDLICDGWDVLTSLEAA
jgi:hypothetical protein